MGGLEGSVGLDAADGLGGGAPDRARGAAVELDGYGGLGDVHGDDLAGVHAASADLACDL